MKRASVREIHHDFARLLAWVEEGEQVEITKRGRVVAKLVPAEAPAQEIVWPDFAARRRRTFPNGIKGKPISEIIDEGRGEY